MQRLLGFWKLRKSDLSPPSFEAEAHTASWDSPRFGKRDLSRAPTNDSHICAGKERLTSSFPLSFGEKTINGLIKDLIECKSKVQSLKIKSIMCKSFIRASNVLQGGEMMVFFCRIQSDFSFM